VDVERHRALLAVSLYDTGAGDHDASRIGAAGPPVLFTFTAAIPPCSLGGAGNGGRRRRTVLFSFGRVRCTGRRRRPGDGRQRAVSTEKADASPLAVGPWTMPARDTVQSLAPMIRSSAAY